MNCKSFGAKRLRTCRNSVLQRVVEWCRNVIQNPELLLEDGNSYLLQGSLQARLLKSLVPLP